MRIKYYRLSLRQMRNEKSFVLFLFLLIFFSSITTLYIKVIEPTLTEFCKSHAYSLAMNATEEAIRTNLEDVDYESVVTTITDENGKITAICANTKEINSISNSIAMDIENNISNIGKTSVKIPLGQFFNLGIVGGAGIKIKIKTAPLGDTKIECISQMDSVGINQTRHRIILKITTNFTITAPVYLKNQSYEKEVVLAETIINGDIPETYYNLDLDDQSDVLNVL